MARYLEKYIQELIDEDRKVILEAEAEILELEEAERKYLEKIAELKKSKQDWIAKTAALGDSDDEEDDETEKKGESHTKDPQNEEDGAYGGAVPAAGAEVQKNPKDDEQMAVLDNEQMAVVDEAIAKQLDELKLKE